jgi:hypothetical protein
MCVDCIDRPFIVRLILRGRSGLNGDHSGSPLNMGGILLFLVGIIIVLAQPSGISTTTVDEVNKAATSKIFKFSL